MEQREYNPEIYASFDVIMLFPELLGTDPPLAYFANKGVLSAVAIIRNCSLVPRFSKYWIGSKLDFVQIPG